MCASRTPPPSSITRRQRADTTDGRRLSRPSRPENRVKIRRSVHQRVLNRRRPTKSGETGNSPASAGAAPLFFTHPTRPTRTLPRLRPLRPEPAVPLGGPPPGARRRVASPRQCRYGAAGPIPQFPELARRPALGPQHPGEPSAGSEASPQQPSVSRRHRPPSPVRRPSGACLFERIVSRSRYLSAGPRRRIRPESSASFHAEVRPTPAWRHPYAVTVVP